MITNKYIWTSSASVPVEDSVLTQAMAHEKKKQTKQQQNNKSTKQKSITAPRQKQYIVRCSSGQVEQNNLSQANEKMKLRLL